MTNHKTIFTTERGERHQQVALRLAPPELAMTMLRQPDRTTLLEHLATAEYWVSERVGELVLPAPPSTSIPTGSGR